MLNLGKCGHTLKCNVNGEVQALAMLSYSQLLVKRYALSIVLSLTALFSLSSCTVCYVCTDSECEDSYSGQDEHAIDCARIDGHTEDGGCSKWKSKARYSGMDYYYGMCCLIVQTLTRVG